MPVTKRDAKGQQVAKYTDEELVDLLTDKIIGEGMGLKPALAAIEYDFSNFYKRCRQSPELMEQVDKIREHWVQMQVDDIIEIGNNVKPNQAEVAKARLRCDNLKWYACKVVPRFNDRVSIDHTTKGEKIGGVDDIARRAILAAAQEIQTPTE